MVDFRRREKVTVVENGSFFFFVFSAKGNFSSLFLT